MNLIFATALDQSLLTLTATSFTGTGSGDSLGPWSEVLPILSPIQKCYKSEA